MTHKTFVSGLTMHKHTNLPKMTLLIDRRKFFLFLTAWLPMAVSIKSFPLAQETLFRDHSEGICIEDRSSDDDEGAHNIDTGADLGEEQNIDVDEDLFDDIQDVLFDARSYLQSFNFSHPKFRSLRDKCKNSHSLCALWAVMGECQNNPLFMNTTCAPVCMSCESLLPEFRCPLDPNAASAWFPGDLNNMFERITNNATFTNYKPRVLSRPWKFDHTYSKDESPYHQEGPWVVHFENFLSNDEADRLIELAINEGFQESYTTLGMRSDGSLDSYAHGSRTSSSTYCESVTCQQHQTTQAVIRRIEMLTNISEKHFEHFHMLRYEEGQLFDTHSDYLYQHRSTQEGVRILTLLMYLNDVEHGGETQFPNLNLKVAPKKGHALLWPSVLDDAPESHDNRTDHGSLPVLNNKGIKYAINVLVHQHDYKTPHKNRCTVS